MTAMIESLQIGILRMLGICSCLYLPWKSAKGHLLLTLPFSSFLVKRPAHVYNVNSHAIPFCVNHIAKCYNGTKDTRLLKVSICM